MIRVEVVIVNYNGLRFLDECLTSLRAQSYRDFSVTLVDNASSDGSTEWVAAHYPEVRVLPLDANVGFAGGNNVAIRACTAEFVALLNSDARADPEWLGTLVRAADGHPWASIFASKILRASDACTVDSAGDLFLTSGVAAKRGEGMPSSKFLAYEEVFGACAAAALYRRSLFDAIGDFDEDLFCYNEDVDLSFRARLAGFRCLFVADATVLHHVGGASGKVPVQRMRWTRRNALEVLLKDMPGGLLLRYGLGMFMHYALGDLYHLVRGSSRAVLLARADNLRRLWRTLRKRRCVQASRRVSARELVAQLTPAEIRIPGRPMASRDALPG